MTGKISDTTCTRTGKQEDLREKSIQDHRLDMKDSRHVLVDVGNEVDVVNNQKSEKKKSSSLFLINSLETKQAKENHRLSPSYRLSRQALDLVYSVLDDAENVLSNEGSKKEENEKIDKKKTSMHGTIATDDHGNSKLEDAKVGVINSEKKTDIIVDTGDSPATKKAKGNQRRLSPSYRLSRQALDLVHSVLDTVDSFLCNTQVNEDSKREENEKIEEKKASMHKTIVRDHNDNSKLEDAELGIHTSVPVNTKKTLHISDSKNVEAIGTVGGNKTMQEVANQSHILAEESDHVSSNSAAFAGKVGKISRDKKLLMIMIMYTVQKWSKTQRESTS